VTTVGEDRDFFRKTLLSVLGALVFVEYLLDLYPLPLVYELLLQPWVALIALCIFAAKKDPQGARSLRILQWFGAATGFALLFHTLWQLNLRGAEINIRATFAEFALPVWLTVGLLPFIWIVALFFQYDKAIRVIFSSQPNPTLRGKIVLALAATHHVNLYRLNDARFFDLKRLASSATFRNALREAQHMVADSIGRRQRSMLEGKRNLQFAGIDQVDEQNRRMDRREFRETQEALRWLQTCQFGRYRRTGRYQKRLLPVVAPRFSSLGLPGTEGVGMSVSRDGQRWYGWRRTISGWYFAIGSDGAPPNEWLFDGPQPPKGFPGVDVTWGKRPFLGDRGPNWH
jgi:hypothetical protein